MNGLNSHGVPMSNGIHLVQASFIAPVKITWLLRGWMAAGKLHILAGPAGTGKTTLALDWAARITNGGLWNGIFPEEPFIKGKVVIWSGEDDVEDTLIPRLIAAGADMSRVHIIRGTIEQGRTRAFNFSKDLPRLSDVIDRMGTVALVIIDSLVQAVSGDSNKLSDVRRSLTPIVELGEQHGCAILGITHLNKGSKGKDPIDRVTGSQAYVAVARVVMLTVKMAASATDGVLPKCVLVRVKSNVETTEGGFEYQVAPAEFYSGFDKFDTSMIQWGEPLQGSAKEILKFAEGTEPAEGTGAVATAESFLKNLLAEGALPFPVIETRAQDAGIKMSAIKRAKQNLQISSTKQSGAGQQSPYLWSMPSGLLRPMHENQQHPARTGRTAFEYQRPPQEMVFQPLFSRPVTQQFGAAPPAPPAPVESVESVESVEPSGLPQSAKPKQDDEIAGLYLNAMVKRLARVANLTTPAEPPDPGVALESSFNNEEGAGDGYGPDEEEDDGDGYGPDEEEGAGDGYGLDDY